MFSQSYSDDEINKQAKGNVPDEDESSDSDDKTQPQYWQSNLDF